MLPGIVLKFLQQTQILPSQGSVGSWYVRIILCKQKFTKIPSHITCHLVKTAVFMPWHHCKVCQLKLHNESHLACAEFSSLPYVITLYSPTYSERKCHSFFKYIYIYTHTHTYMHTHTYIYKTAVSTFPKSTKKNNFSSGICSKTHCLSNPSHCANENICAATNKLHQENDLPES